MSFKLNATQRVRAYRARANQLESVHTNLDTPNDGAYGSDDGTRIHQPADLVDAAFDNTREHELIILEPHLKAKGLPYALKDGCLTCRIPLQRGHWLATQTISVLQSAGLTMYLKGNPLGKVTFAINGPDGLVYQRLQAVHRIFYTRK